jgi:hypothetical protein
MVADVVEKQRQSQVWVSIDASLADSGRWTGVKCGCNGNRVARVGKTSQFVLQSSL